VARGLAPGPARPPARPWPGEDHPGLAHVHEPNGLGNAARRQPCDVDPRAQTPGIQNHLVRSGPPPALDSIAGHPSRGVEDLDRRRSGPGEIEAHARPVRERLGPGWREAQGMRPDARVHGDGPDRAPPEPIASRGVETGPVDRQALDEYAREELRVLPGGAV